MVSRTLRIPKITLVMLVSVACVTAVALPATAGATGSDEDTYVVTQGDEEFEISPVGDGSQTAAEFYDYRTPETHEYPDYLYSSYGTTEYQEDDTSILMLHEGSDGLSLVLVHDRVDGDTRGGSLTMQIDGLPEEVDLDPAAVQGSPETILALDPAVRDAVVEAFSGALSTTFLVAVPLALLATVLLAALPVQQLRETRHVGRARP